MDRAILQPLHGNATVRARLARAAEEQRLHHCFVFEGPEGVGKFAYAQRFAMEINCVATAQPSMFGPPTPVERPCGECEQCRWILAGTHPDIVIVEPDPSRATAILTAAQAREIVNGLLVQRHSARYRVVILHPADALGEDAANILLKTLEEPPPGTQFILVTSRPASLLQTVRSRSQRVRFGPLSDDEMRVWLTSRSLPPDLLEPAAGSPGRALALAEGEADARAELLDALCAVVGQPLHVLFAFTEAQAKAEGDSAELVLQVFEELLADTVAMASGRPVRHLEREVLLRRWVRGLWPGGVGRLQVEIALARDRLRLNVQTRVVLEPLLAHLNLELAHLPA